MLKISVIIPIYNVAEYIERCLHSIVSQSYLPYECILIDDCGTDDSIHIAAMFIQNYNGTIRFTILHHQHNSGLSAARNTGIKEATGEYIYFMDSDDSITPDCLETLVQLAKKHPNADYIQGNIVSGMEGLMEGTIDPDVPEFVDDRHQLENIILCKTHRTAWNRLLKRSFLLSNQLFFPVGIVMEDHYWTYFVAKYAQSVAFTHKGTYYYYNHAGSIVNARSKQHYIRNYSSYLIVIKALTNDLLLRKNIYSFHKQYVAEAVVFCLMNVARVYSFLHWLKFWKTICYLTWTFRKRMTMKCILFFLCIMPPLCFMVNIKRWNWRLRQYLIVNL